MILAVLQARMSSTRLAGKILKPILGVPMLLRQIERVNRSEKIDKIVVATSNQETDDPVEYLCNNNCIDVYRGSLDDVLDRFYQCARSYPASHVVRLTGDCPLIDPLVIDNVIESYLKMDCDYMSNTLEPTFPDGIDVEVFRFSALERAWLEARLLSEREHVTPYIYKNPSIFKLGNFKGEKDLSHLRWTVDEKEDFELVSEIYSRLYPGNPSFGTKEILALLDENKELVNFNERFIRNEGYLKSINKDSLN